MELSNFKIENDDLSINDFMFIYETGADPVDQIVQTTVLAYIRQNIGGMTPNELVDHLSQYGDAFQHHVTNFFEK